MKNIYITWHYTTHGVAYLKHILSKFYLLGKLPSEKLDLSKLEQEELNSIFDSPIENGFVFDEIIYLIAPQKAFDGLSSRRFSHRNTVLEDPVIKESKLSKTYAEIIERFPEHKLAEEIEFLEAKYPKLVLKYKELVWRNIQHYPLEEQIQWLTKYSNFKNVYKEKFKVVELNVDDLRNEKQISDEVSRWARQYFLKQKNVQPIINVSLGSNETQVVWHILSEAGQLPDNTRFIKTYDDKSDKPEKRFKQFFIKEIPTNLISKIGAEFKVYIETKSPSRELVNKKMETFLKSGFSILLRGERGTGKSRIAIEARRGNDKFIAVNCASFPDDTMAEAELFGYVPGTFTGGLKDGKNGKFIDANGGILFLDEIHHLSKIVQAKLMTAIQTKKGGIMDIWKLGSKEPTQIKCRLIFATNKNIGELKELLLPDFYDRIVQHVIEIPSLSQTTKDRAQDWENTWKHLFSEVKPEMPKVPKEPELLNWLSGLSLSGNWRDLEKIAMYYYAFDQFEDETKKMLNENNAFQYAKNEFEKYHSLETLSKNDDTIFKFSTEKNAVEIEADFKCFLQDWATKKFGSRKEAAIRLGVTEKAFNDWKNKRSIKPKG
jgi:transcriptional regulator with PAS, ATPase and Fis domain